MTACKPLAGKPLTFWHVAGDVVWRGDGRPTWIEAAQVENLLDEFKEAIRCAVANRDNATADQAGELFVELHKAREAQRNWVRIVNNGKAA